MSSKIVLGCIAREKITGFQGTVIAKTTQLSNCPRYTLQPPTLKDGVPLDCRSTDEMQLEYVSSSDHDVWSAARPKEHVELGDTVEDKITGLRGVAFAHTIWSNGCSRVSVQPRELKDGVPVNPTTIDEKDLRIIETATPKPVAAKTGGPRSEPRRR